MAREDIDMYLQIYKRDGIKHLLFKDKIQERTLECKADIKKSQLNAPKRIESFNTLATHGIICRYNIINSTIYRKQL